MWGSLASPTSLSPIPWGLAGPYGVLGPFPLSSVPFRRSFVPFSGHTFSVVPSFRFTDFGHFPGLHP